MEIIAKAKSIEQFFIPQNREDVEILNVPVRNSTEMLIVERGKPGERLETKDTEILTSRAGNSPLA
jgi:hypothetical protein